MFRWFKKLRETQRIDDWDNEFRWIRKLNKRYQKIGRVCTDEEVKRNQKVQLMMGMNDSQLLKEIYLELVELNIYHQTKEGSDD